MAWGADDALEAGPWSVAVWGPTLASPATLPGAGVKKAERGTAALEASDGEELDPAAVAAVATVAATADAGAAPEHTVHSEPWLERSECGEGWECGEG